MPPVLLGVTGLDALNSNAQSQPPRRVGLNASRRGFEKGAFRSLLTQRRGALRSLGGDQGCNAIRHPWRGLLIFRAGPRLLPDRLVVVRGIELGPIATPSALLNGER